MGYKENVCGETRVSRFVDELRWNSIHFLRRDTRIDGRWGDHH